MARKYIAPAAAVFTFVVIAWALPAWSSWEADPARWSGQTRGVSFGFGILLGFLAYAFARIDQEL